MSNFHNIGTIKVGGSMRSSAKSATHKGGSTNAGKDILWNHDSITLTNHDVTAGGKIVITAPDVNCDGSTLTAKDLYLVTDADYSDCTLAGQVHYGTLEDTIAILNQEL